MGCVGFTAYCWLVKGKSRGRVLSEWKEERRRRHVDSQGAALMARIRQACPESLDGWKAIPYRNDLAGNYYGLINRIRLQYHYRRPDGSDNISLDVVINPPLAGMPWYEVSPFIPETARKLDTEPGIQAWIHQAYRWNAYLPPYDQKPENPSAYTAQVFIGDWAVKPFSEAQRREQDLENRRIVARGLEFNHGRPDLEDPDGRIDPMGVPANLLSPVFQVPIPHQIMPASLPNAEMGSVHPRCLAVQIIGRDERSVKDMLARVDLKTLVRLTQGN
jgi:hypothetical protein